MSSLLSLTTFCIPLLSLLCAGVSAWVVPLPPSVDVGCIPLHATFADDGGEEFVMPPVDQLVSDTPVDERGIGVGIDLGTTNSAAAILVDGVPAIVPVGDDNGCSNGKGGRTIPSVVTMLSKDEALVGKEAVQAEVDNPSATYRNVKRVLGQGGTTAAVSAEVVPNLLVNSASVRRKGRNIGKHKSTMQPSLTQQLKEAEESPARLQCAVEDVSALAPEEISAKVLRRLYDAVEKQRGTGEKVTRAVIGVPAYFNDAQRDATLRASKLAGVEKARLLREPEAAALAYGIGKEQAGEKEDDELVLVFDLGGGTFDVSILEVGGGITEVVATAGNNMLGGSDFDTRVAEFMAKRVAAHGADKNYMRDGGDVADAIVRCAEAVRVFLSNNKVANLALPLTADGWLKIANARDVLLFGTSKELSDLTEAGTSNSTHVLCQLTRKEMEELCLDELLALLKPVREVALLSRAMLPGDANPEAVMAAMEMEEEMDQMADGRGQAFQDFFDDVKGEATSREEDEIDADTLLMLKEVDIKEKKKAQQRGRKKARELAASSKKFRKEKRKADETSKIKLATGGKRGDNAKVRDGITGRPISQVVLVGGATRMPAIGRLLAAMTGVVPQKTVNPDEAVALGCAVQVGILDGDQNLGGFQVLNPFQASLMRAMAKQQMQSQESGVGTGDDDDEFAGGEVIFEL
jgi:molecular chaperone DnaK (HSP70)